MSISNGTEAAMWRSNNCDVCEKNYDYINYPDPSDDDCKLELSMQIGYLTDDDARRLGLDTEHKFGRSCTEFVAKVSE